MICSITSAQENTSGVLVLTPPIFEGDTLVHTESGMTRLVWDVDAPDSIKETLIYEFQQASDSLFENYYVRYRGPDLATYISGLKDGIYYYRVRALGPDSIPVSQWSGITKVQVDHHSLNLALIFFVVGGVVFVATAGVVIFGTTNNSNQENV